MPQIIPIRDLKNTSEISEICHRSDEPVFVTKNGYGDMVIMSIETYEKAMTLNCCALLMDILSTLTACFTKAVMLNILLAQMATSTNMIIILTAP